MVGCHERPNSPSSFSNSMNLRASRSSSMGKRPSRISLRMRSTFLIERSIAGHLSHGLRHLFRGCRHLDREHRNIRAARGRLLLHGSTLLLASGKGVGLGFAGDGESIRLDFIDCHVVSPTFMSV